MATEFEVDQIYQELLNRPFADGQAVLQSYANMSPEEVRNFVASSPEGQIAAQFQTSLDRPVGEAGRAYYMNLVNTGLQGVQDVNADGAVTLDDVLFNISQSPEAMALQNMQSESALTDAGFSPFEFSAPNLTEIINPNATTIPMQVTGGSQILPTDTNLGFYGVNPNTGKVELMQQDTAMNPMFRAGVGGFTNTLPFQFDFGIPAVTAEVPIFTASGVDFVSAKDAADAEAEAAAAVAARSAANNPYMGGIFNDS